MILCIVVAYFDHARYLEHDPGHSHLDFILFAPGIGFPWYLSPKGLVHNLLMQFFTLHSSRVEAFKFYFL